MKIALIQLNIIWESKKANCDNAELFAKKAFDEGCDLMVLPEMFSTGFSMNVSTLTEDKDGETAMVLSSLAKQYYVNIIAGFTVKDFDGKMGRNMAVVFDRNGDRIAEYTKLHPFSYAGEDQYYIAGSAPVIFNIDRMKASIFICYDLRFPEIFRIVAKHVQAIFIIANWPASRKDHWETLLKARAIENQCFVIGVNRTGKDGNGIDYPGASCVYSPLGNKICSGDEKEEFVTCEIDLNEVNEVRTRFPFLKDMRAILTPSKLGS